MVQFNFSYQTATDASSEVLLEQMTAFEVAGRIWSTYLKDDITVNVHIGMSSNLPTNVIGGALPGINSKQSSYDFADYLRSDSTSEDDWSSTNHLSGHAIANDFIVWHQGKVDLTTANAKALGMTPKDSNALDGMILMSDLSNLTWNQDENASNNIIWDYPESSTSQNSAYRLDFLSVALHELGHILGFMSGVDSFAWFQELEQTQQLIQNGNLLVQRLVSHYGYALKYFSKSADFGQESRTMPLDFFRYSNESRFWGVRDLSVGEDAYFSIDGGQTSLADFSTSKYGNGDGYQASHWKNAEDTLGVMMPALSLNQTNNISMLDLQAFDVIGWDLADSLLGSDRSMSQSEFLQTFDVSNSQTLSNLWQVAESHVLQIQSTLQTDRLTDVLQMIENSGVYEKKKKKKKKGGGNGSWQELWQEEVVDVFTQEGSFSTFGIKALEVDESISTLRNQGEKSGEGFITAWTVDSNTNQLVDGLSMSDQRGTQNNDNLQGNDGRDRLIGKQGQDFLKGKGGDDLLRGGRHRDVLIGGTGSDTFVLQDKQGYDVVRDFSDGEDYVRLGHQLSFDQLIIGQQGGHTTIHYRNGLLMVLRNVSSEVITGTDFI